MSDAEERDAPETRDHRLVTGSLQYELGRADVEHAGDLAAAEAYCYSNPTCTDADFDVNDWLLPVHASGGRIVLKVKLIPEAAYVRQERGQLQARVWNDVLLDHKDIWVDREDVQRLIGEAGDVELVPRHRSRFAGDDDE